MKIPSSQIYSRCWEFIQYVLTTKKGPATYQGEHVLYNRFVMFL